MAGRPSEYNFEMCKEICEQVARGQNVIAVLESKDEYPSWSNFRHWKLEHEELQTMYIKSIQDKATACDFEIDVIQQELRNKILDPSTANVLIQTLKWKAAKYYPKMFGDKVDITSKDEKISNITLIDYSKLSTKALEEIEAASNRAPQGNSGTL